MEYSQFLMDLVAFFSTVQGQSVLAVAAGLAQLALKAFQTPLADFAGKYKLVVVSGVTVLATVLGSMLTGLSFTAALLSGGAVTALQVFVHQVYTQFFVKKVE
jgi:hypothetical protein